MTITCQQLMEWSSEYLDGELDAARAAEVAVHTETCSRCHAFLASLRTSVRLLGDDQYFAMPAGVHERLHAAIATGLDEPLAPLDFRPAQVHVPKPAPPVVPSSSRSHWRWSSWALAAVVILAAIGFFRTRASAITTSGWLIDSHCLTSYRAKLAEHPTECLLKCGQKLALNVGLVDAQGHFLRFDAKGRSRVLAEVRAAHRPDHLWVTVRGKRSGPAQAPVLDVEQVELTPPGTTSLGADITR